MPLPVVDPYNIFAQAEGFTDASTSMLDASNIPTGNMMMRVVSVATSAFAVELYLKCLIVIEGKPVPREHNLSRLYAKLSADTQESLQAHYQAFLPEYLPTMVDTRPASVPRGPRDYVSALSNAERKFEQYRYFFEAEGNMTSVALDGALECLLIATRESILTIRPDWDTNYPALMTQMVLLPQTDLAAQISNLASLGVGKDEAQYELQYKCLNGACPEMTHIVFNMQPGLSLPEPLEDGQQVFAYPSDGIIRCPRCHANSKYSIIQEALESYTGRGVHII